MQQTITFPQRKESEFSSPKKLSSNQHSKSWHAGQDGYTAAVSLSQRNTFIAAKKVIFENFCKHTHVEGTAIQSTAWDILMRTFSDVSFNGWSDHLWSNESLYCACAIWTSSKSLLRHAGSSNPLPRTVSLAAVLRNTDIEIDAFMLGLQSFIRTANLGHLSAEVQTQITSEAELLLKNQPKIMRVYEMLRRLFDRFLQPQREDDIEVQMWQHCWMLFSLSRLHLLDREHWELDDAYAVAIACFFSTYQLYCSYLAHRHAHLVRDYLNTRAQTESLYAMSDFVHRLRGPQTPPALLIPSSLSSQPTDSVSIDADPQANLPSSPTPVSQPSVLPFPHSIEPINVREFKAWERQLCRDHHMDAARFEHAIGASFRALLDAMADIVVSIEKLEHIYRRLVASAWGEIDFLDLERWQFNRPKTPQKKHHVPTEHSLARKPVSVSRLDGLHPAQQSASDLTPRLNQSSLEQLAHEPSLALIHAWEQSLLSGSENERSSLPVATAEPIPHPRSPTTPTSNPPAPTLLTSPLSYLQEALSALSRAFPRDAHGFRLARNLYYATMDHLLQHATRVLQMSTTALLRNESQSRVLLAVCCEVIRQQMSLDVPFLEMLQTLHCTPMSFILGIELFISAWHGDRLRVHIVTKSTVGHLRRLEEHILLETVWIQPDEMYQLFVGEHVDKAERYLADHPPAFIGEARHEATVSDTVPSESDVRACSAEELLLRKLFRMAFSRLVEMVREMKLVDDLFDEEEEELEEENEKETSMVDSHHDTLSLQKTTVLSRSTKPFRSASRNDMVQRTWSIFVQALEKDQQYHLMAHRTLDHLLLSALYAVTKKKRQARMEDLVLCYSRMLTRREEGDLASSLYEEVAGGGNSPSGRTAADRHWFMRTVVATREPRLLALLPGLVEADVRLYIPILVERTAHYVQLTSDEDAAASTRYCDLTAYYNRAFLPAHITMIRSVLNQAQVVARPLPRYRDPRDAPRRISTTQKIFFSPKRPMVTRDALLAGSPVRGFHAAFQDSPLRPLVTTTEMPSALTYSPSASSSTLLRDL